MTNTDIKDLRRIQVVQVLALKNSQNIPFKKGCEIVGISYSTFARVHADYPDLVPEFIATIKSPIRALYEDMLNAQEQLIRGLINKASEPDLKPKDAIAILTQLQMQSKIVEQELTFLEIEPTEGIDPTATGVSITTAEKYLEEHGSAPTLRKGVSKITQQTTTTVEFQEEEQPVDAIDGTVS